MRGSSPEPVLGNARRHPDGDDPPRTFARAAGAARPGPYDADAFRIDQRAGVIAVADGIGSTGRAAAEHALAAMWVHLDDLGDPAGMDAAFAEANRAVMAACPDAGTTLTVVALAGGRAVIGHIGDTRAWLCRQGRGTLLTSDHSVARSRAAEGHAVAAGSPLETELRRRLERYLGWSPPRHDIDTVDVMPGDVMVVCSDGLWSSLDLAEVAGLAASTPVDQLPAVLLAHADGSDDASVVVATLPVSVGVQVTGSEHQTHLLPGQELRFGRSSEAIEVEMSFRGNRHLSAHAGTVTATEQGWTLANVGRYLTFEVTEEVSGTVLCVDPGEKVVGTTAQATVTWHPEAPGEELRLACDALAGSRSPIKQTPPTTTVRPYDLGRAPRQRLVAVALCEPVLRARAETHVPTDGEVANRLAGLDEPMTQARVAKIVSEDLFPRVLADIPVYGGRTRAELVRRLLLTGVVRPADLDLLPPLPDDGDER